MTGQFTGISVNSGEAVNYIYITLPVPTDKGKDDPRQSINWNKTLAVIQCPPNIGHKGAGKFGYKVNGVCVLIAYAVMGV